MHSLPKKLKGKSFSLRQYSLLDLIQCKTKE
jgi:hypothetical protein